MTFYLAGPIYVTLMAAVFLREPVGWRRWTAVLLGFVGVVVASVPSASSFGWPVLIAIAGSICYATFLVLTRSLRGTNDVVMATWQVISALIFGAILTPFVWVTPETWFDAPLLLLLGVASLLAIVFVNRAFALAPASVVVPYQYTLVVWAVVFGYLVFGDVPRVLTLVGAAIIVAAGLFIYFREAKLGVEIEPEAPPER
jgi:drug/metabolite transporter (DMT)-like permease